MIVFEAMKTAQPDDYPNTFYVMVEISMGGNNKYEYNEKLETIVLDRMLFTSMSYPTNYGMIIGTHAEDGDPLDVLIISSSPIQPGIIVRCRPVGIAEMKDEEGQDHKIIAVPVDSVDPNSSSVRDVEDIPVYLKNNIKHFFEHYKELETDKFMNFFGYGKKENAIREINEANGKN